VAEFTTCYTGTKGKVADRNSVIFECVGKVIIAFCHGTDENADALFGPKSLDVVLDTYYRALKGECDLTTIGGKMLSDWVFNHAKKLLLRSCGSNGHAMEELNHETSKTLECTRDADGGVDFDKDAFRGVDIDLEFAGLVDGRVEEGKEALWESVYGVQIYRSKRLA
jgi:hypothetical protein